MLALAVGLNFANGASGQSLSNRGSEANGESQTDEQQQQPSEFFSTPVEIIESAGAAETREANEKAQRDLQQRDLAAQEGMNAATQSIDKTTWRMYIVSIINAVFVAVGTALLIWTLRLTSQANTAAQKAVLAT